VASSWFSLYSTIKMMHGPINIRFNKYCNARNIWAEGIRIYNVYGLLCNVFGIMDWTHNCTKHSNFNWCYVTQMCVLTDHQTPMPKHVKNNNKSAVMQINLHRQQGDIDRKINIEYFSKNVEIKRSVRTDKHSHYTYSIFSCISLFNHKSQKKNTHTHTYINTHIPTHTRIHTHTYINTHIPTHTHTHAYTHIHKHTHTHTHTHTYTTFLR